MESAAPGLLAGPLTGCLLAGGKSNLTYRIDDGHRSFVVRRPPLGHVLDTAHDMAREYRVLTALHDAPVPVPTTFLLCQDDSVLGAPFYVMEHVEGTAYSTAAELTALGPARTERISRRCVETLGLVHAVDPVAVGLTDFGRPAGFAQRQVRRWQQQLDASRTRPLPDADLLAARLTDRAPVTSPTGIVHGDYRLDNLLVDGDDRVAAVLDWEMATLGDPLTDLGLLLVYEWAAPIASCLPNACLAPGFVSGDRLLQSYAEMRGTDLPPLGFYRGLAAFKLAVILEGIHRRQQEGKVAGDGPEGVGEMVRPLLAHGLTVLSSD